MQTIITFLLFVSIARSQETGNLLLKSIETVYDEDTAEDLLCNNLNASISFSSLRLNEIKEKFLSSPLITCLKLNSNSINTIYPKAFNNLPNLKYLDLSNNYFNFFTVLQDDLFEIETLIFNDCRASDYRDQCVIRGFYPKLKKLFLKNSNLYYIRSDNDYNLPSLTHLYLSDNHLNMPEFSWLPNSIQYLDLSRNHLQSVQLSNLTNLNKLFVDNQNYQSLTTIDFENLISLKYLSMKSNSIGDISFSTFKNATSLTYLDVSDNKIKYIEGGSFDDLKNLRFLNLSNNDLEIVQAGTFDKLQNLRTLILEKNLITMFPMVGHEIKLQSLLLNCNKIRSIVGGMFSNMPDLESLFLHDNELSYLDQEAFRGLKNLKVLTLSHNQLSSLPSNWMVPLNALNELDLIGNSLKNFSNLALSESSSLQNLYLSNQLEYINAQELFAIPDNLTIHLRNDVTFVEQCNKLTDRKYNPNYYG